MEKFIDFMIEKKEIRKTATIVIGPAGSGSTTLTLLLAHATLETVADHYNNGTLRIVDESEQIGNGTSGITTTVPHLIVDDIDGRAYFDCPGFTDSKQVNKDTQTTLMFQKLMDSADSYKFIFTVPYQDIEVNGDDAGLIKLFEYLGNFFDNNIKDFKDDAFLMVVTKVPHHVNDATIQNEFRNALSSIRSIKNEKWQSADIYSDMYLNDKFGVLRTPSQEGPYMKQW